MKLFLLIVLFSIIGYFLLLLPPVIGGAIAFGILMGCLSRGLYLLNNMSKRITNALPTQREIEFEEHKLELKKIKKF